MNLSIKNHILHIDGKQVEYRPSPNHGSDLKNLQYLILHYTATIGFNSPFYWLTDETSQVSAHLLIGRDGRIAQLLPFNKIGYHAGVSKWKGVIGLNPYSIGIEIVNAGILAKKADGYYSADGKIVEDYIQATNNIGLKATWQKYTDEQLNVVKNISFFLKQHYNLKDILGHEDISPIRKSDPGPAFPWSIIDGSTKLTTTLVNVRVLAEIDAPKACPAIPANTQINIILEGKEWDYIEVNGINGYINNKYLK